MAQVKRTRTQKSLEATLWEAADKLRGNLEAAEYKHVVLGLVFLKYVSDAFTTRRLVPRARIPQHEPGCTSDKQQAAGGQRVRHDSRVAIWRNCDTLHLSGKTQLNPFG